MALKSYNLCFINEKQKEKSFLYCQDQYFSSLKHVLKETPESLQKENNNLDEFKSTEVVERMAVAALNSLGMVLGGMI